MKVEVTTRRADQMQADALIVPLCATAKLPRSMAGLDRALGGAIRRAIEHGDFCGKADEVVILPASGARVRRVVLVGLGEEQRLGAESLRRAAGSGVRAVMSRRSRTAALVVPRTKRISDSDAGQACVEGGLLGGYRFDRYRSSNELPRPPDSLTVVGDERDAAVLRRAVRVGAIVAESANLARDLSNEPGSVHTPAWLATRARSMGRQVGARVRVFGPRELQREHMGGILAVGRGSEHTPRLIEFDYRPSRKERRRTPIVALVGKGITFDTGGISLKPAATMDEMKHDMSGGAAVFGAVRAAALLRLPIRVVGLVAAAENKPGARAYLPGDVIRSASGRTIEVLNTDAEGRIVLADALHHARSFRPDAIIDLATLTGACVIALGTHCSAAMGNDEPLIQRVREAGDRTGERVWPLPLWDEYREQVRGQVGDLKNTGGREGGTITAAAFLSHFVGETPWVHLDIAGTAFTKKDLPYCPIGATGVGVRLLSDLLRGWSGRS